MKIFSIRLLLAIYTLFNSLAVLGQTKSIPDIRSSIVDFSDIVKYDLDHPDTIKKELRMNKVLPAPYVLPINEKVLTDPFGKMDTASVNSSGSGTSEAPIINFNGLDDNGTSIPPDVHGAVGPSHVMTTLNTQVRIQNLTGSTISTVSLDAFWASLGNPDVFDPKVIYEPYNNRWIFSACANSGLATSSILIGVSQTNNPTGTWSLYKIDADATNLNWFDYPSMGFNKDWIVVTGNLFTISGGTFVNAQVYVFKKSDLYASIASPQFTLLTPSGGFTLSPAVTMDNTISTLYLMQRFNGNSGGSGLIKLYTITGAVGSETISSGVTISTPNPWSSGPPTENFAPQSGSALKIAVNDDRMRNTVYRNGSIWAVQTVYLPAGGVSRTAVQWWQVSTSGSILQRGRIDDPSGNSFYAFPSIAVNSANDALIGYSKFNSGIFASGCYALRASTDPVNTFQAEFLFKAGLAPYFKTFSGTKNRWGDYTATMTDPDGTDFWTIQQYASTPSGSDRWGTWWAKVEAPCTHANVNVSISANPPGIVCFGTRVTFTATATNPGVSPVYQWKKNGTVVGSNSTTYTDTPGNGTTISCTLTSSISSCTVGNPATTTITQSINSINDGNACTTDACNTLTGATTHTPVSTNDGNACTTDACNTSTGVVTHNAVNVNDGNGCTIDACNTTSGAITHTPVNVDDNNPCTTDGCESSSGVYHNPVTTNDNNACTIDGCDSVTGVFHNEINSDDNNPCTTDSCDTSTGIIAHDPVSTDDGDICTDDGCNSITGIFHTPNGNCGVTLHTKIFIQGFYTGAGLMDNNGLGGALFVTNVSTDPTDADTVSISAINPLSPYGEVNKQTGLLKTNGDVTVNFGASVISGNSYFIKILHRNSVETWSNTPIVLNANTSYLFSSGLSQAFGNNQAITFDNLYAAIYSGDINRDGAIDGADFLELDPSIQNGDGGYAIGDLNGDGAVDGADFLVLDPNIQNGVGANIPNP